MQYSKDILQRLDSSINKIKYARVYLLNQKEEILEEIQGKITDGSITIDGTSTVRRICSLTIVSNDVDINDFYWGINNKFKVEIGEVDPETNNIIWFKEGTFIITSFSETINNNSYTISITGKDKMCLLNGDIGGNVTSYSWDFGQESYTDEEGNTVLEDIPIKDIIKYILREYAGEPDYNIVIEDIDDSGRVLVNYSGTQPAYAIFRVKDDICERIEFDGSLTCGSYTLSSIPVYDTRLKVVDDYTIPTQVTFGSSGVKYTVAKIQSGDTIGYRPTEVTYSGDLIASAGDPVTSILDKLVEQLGNFEYYYDVNGKFIFHRKPSYTDTKLNNIKIDGEEIQINPSVDVNEISYLFSGNKLVSTFTNTPNITDLKNDYAIWGKRETTSGAEINFHLRYAIHQKPTYYKSLAGKEYTSEDTDWREIIYQMAEDYFNNHDDNSNYYRLVQLNNGKLENGAWRYPRGITGYEMYYTDMDGFWRLIYCPVGEYSNSYLTSSEFSKGTYYTRSLVNYNDANGNLLYRDFAYTQATEYDYTKTYFYKIDSSSEEFSKEGWSYTILNDPKNLIFWIDFMDNASDLMKYSVDKIGDRTKVIKDEKITSIYYRETPEVVFYDSEDETETALANTLYGYTKIKITDNISGLLVYSSDWESGLEVLDENLYKYATCTESISISSIPVYYLEANTKVSIIDDNTGINGEYLISKITLPLNYSGSMSITGVKVTSQMY